MPGSRPGERRGGRKKGAKNKATVALTDEIIASGELPKDYMLRVMRDPTVDHARRDDMAKAVAGYIHARLTAQEISGAGGGPVKLEHITREIIYPKSRP